LPVFLIDCRSRPGQSGSPVYAHRTAGAVFDNGGVSLGTGESYSRFLGVYSGRIHPEADIGLVWTAQAVLDVVRNGTAGKVVGSA
jgi:V8-like Glu-specific endopeptidase